MKIYKVGGCVRDKILGRSSNDTDYVVVGSTREEMLEQGFTQVGSHVRYRYEQKIKEMEN